jgi:hypothetical protein
VYANPTPEQLNKINQFIPANMQPWEAAELAVIEFIATDNLLNRSFGKWGVQEIAKLAQLAIGLPCILNHDWDEVENSQGLIFDSRVEKYQAAPDWAINQAENGELNQQIVEEEGYTQLIAIVTTLFESAMLPNLRLGSVGKVSLGAFRYKQQVCPICRISFNDESCPHGIPDPWWGMTFKEDPRIAPYYIRTGVYDLGELSLVTIPNIPTAGILTRQKLIK